MSAAEVAAVAASRLASAEMEAEIFETSDDEPGSPMAPAGGAALRKQVDETFEEEGSAVEGETIDPLAAFETFMGRSFDPSEGEGAAPPQDVPPGEDGRGAFLVRATICVALQFPWHPYLGAWGRGPGRARRREAAATRPCRVLSAALFCSCLRPHS